MSTVAQLVDDIYAAPAPVVFLDTCAILDVVRAPRDDKVIHAAAAAETFVALARQTPRAVYLVVSDIVPKEWDDNRNSARAETNAKLNAYSHVTQVAESIAAALNISPLFPPLLSLPDVLEYISKALLDACVIVDRDPALLNPAMHRVLTKPPPAKEKNDIKDWYIFEHYLAVARGLAARAFTPRMVFVSSNTKDFAASEKGTRKPHPDLAADLAAAELRYAVSLDSAVAQLRGNLQIP